jgi:RNA polymerase sigma-70 factor (ECF subfamily)
LSWIGGFPTRRASSDRGPLGAELEDDHEVAGFRSAGRKSEWPARNGTGSAPEVGKVGQVLITSTTRIGESLTRSWAELAVLVRRAQVGDREAFGKLVEQFQPTVHAIALRRLGNAADAVELTQEVFLHVLERIDQLREPERFAGWLRQVAVRMAINRATRRLFPPCVEAGVLESASEQTEEPLEQLITRERSDRLWEALGRLKEIDREALDAFYIRGHSLLEIAESLGVPLGTVKRRLHTARKRLRLELEAAVADAREWSDGQYDDPDEEFDEPELVGVGAGAGSMW